MPSLGIGWSFLGNTCFGSGPVATGLKISTEAMMGVCGFLSVSLLGVAVGDVGSPLSAVSLPKLEATDVG